MFVYSRPHRVTCKELCGFPIYELFRFIQPQSPLRLTLWGRKDLGNHNIIIAIYLRAFSATVPQQVIIMGGEF